MPHALLGDAKGPVADGPAAEGQGKAQMTTPDIREAITTLLTALLKDTGLTVPLHIKVTMPRAGTSSSRLNATRTPRPSSEIAWLAPHHDRGSLWRRSYRNSNHG